MRALDLIRAHLSELEDQFMHMENKLAGAHKREEQLKADKDYLVTKSKEWSNAPSAGSTIPLEWAQIDISKAFGMDTIPGEGLFIRNICIGGYTLQPSTRWRAWFTDGGGFRLLGFFDTPEEAKLSVYSTAIEALQPKTQSKGEE